MIKWIIAGCVLALSGTAVAACPGYGIAGSQPAGSDDYDPAAPTEEVLGLSLRAVGAVDPACAALAVTIRPSGRQGLRLRNGPSALDTSILASGAFSTAASNAISLSAATRTALAGGETVTFDVLSLRPGQFARSGRYALPLEVEIGSEIRDLVTLRVDVIPSIRFENASRSGQHRIDLGELSDGAQAGAAFFYRTNATLRVDVRSDNNGALLHETEDGPHGRIAYVAFVNGRRIGSLDGTESLEFLRTDGGIQAGQVRIEVPPSPGRYAGIYRDVLTLTFTPF